MPETPRQLWQIPAFDQDPWYAPVVALFNGIDSAVFSGKERTNAVMSGGGTVGWSSSTLSWSATIQMLSPYTGFAAQVAAGGISIPVDGQMLWLDMPAGLTSNPSLSFQVSSNLPNSDTATLIAVRLGGSLYFRNGQVLGNGQAFSGGVGAAPASSGYGAVHAITSSDGPIYTLAETSGSVLLTVSAVSAALTIKANASSQANMEVDFVMTDQSISSTHTVAFDGNGKNVVYNGTSASVQKFSPDGTGAGVTGAINYGGLSFALAGTIWVAK